MNVDESFVVTYPDLIIETLFLSSFLRGLYLLSDK